MRRLWAAAFKLAAIALFAAFGLAVMPASPRAVLAQGLQQDHEAGLPGKGALEKLQITTATGAHEFSVEAARTEPQRQRGLMHRRFLPADRGMLFSFEAQQPISMWMKNTYIPLDMIFIDRKGKVVGLAENAEPLSEKVISSGAPAWSVLEVNAGVAARIGLKIGDLVRHPLFAN